MNSINPPHQHFIRTALISLKRLSQGKSDKIREMSVSLLMTEPLHWPIFTFLLYKKMPGNVYGKSQKTFCTQSFNHTICWINSWPWAAIKQRSDRSISVGEDKVCYYSTSCGACCFVHWHTQCGQEIEDGCGGGSPEKGEGKHLVTPYVPDQTTGGAQSTAGQLLAYI